MPILAHTLIQNKMLSNFSFQAVFTPARIGKQYWIGILLTHENDGDFGAISVTERKRSCAASISEVQSHVISDSNCSLYRKKSFSCRHEKLSGIKLNLFSSDVLRYYFIFQYFTA